MKKYWIAIGALLYFLMADAVSAQSASLTATVRVNPLKVEVGAPSFVVANKWFDITAEISNLGLEPIEKTDVTINSSSKVTIRGKKKKLGTLNAGKSVVVIWQAKARNPSDLVIQIEAVGKLAGEDISTSDSVLISATSSAGFALLRQILASVF